MLSAQRPILTGLAVEQAPRAILTNDWNEIQAWLREYQRCGYVMPQPAVVRFLIGQYQMRQARACLDIGLRRQAYTAAAMHFVMVGEELDLAVDLSLKLTDDGWPDLQSLPCCALNWERVLDDLCLVAQMIVYEMYAEGTNRRQRYKPDVLRATLTRLVSSFLGAVPPEERARRLFDEMAIISGDLVERKA